MRLVTHIRSDWPRIKLALLAVLAKSDEDWIAEDVYHALQSGQAACHVCDDGILITQRLLTDFTARPYLHVWIAHGTNVDDNLDFLRDLARRAGCERITFGSTRMGWAKRFPLVSATFEVSL